MTHYFFKEVFHFWILFSVEKTLYVPSYRGSTQYLRNPIFTPKKMYEHLVGYSKIRPRINDLYPVLKHRRYNFLVANKSETEKRNRLVTHFISAVCHTEWERMSLVYNCRERVVLFDFWKSLSPILLT